MRIVAAREAPRSTVVTAASPVAPTCCHFRSRRRPAPRSDMLGDLVICAPVVMREARALRRPAPAHWAHMVVHGILHLRGYDHGNKKDAVVMERREARVLRALECRKPLQPPRCHYEQGRRPYRRCRPRFALAARPAEPGIAGRAGDTRRGARGAARGTGARHPRPRLARHDRGRVPGVGDEGARPSWCRAARWMWWTRTSHRKPTSRP